MSTFQWKAINSICAIVGVAFILPNSAVAQSQTTGTQMDQPNRVSVAYVAPKESPFRLPEELTIKTAECGVVNSWYTRENFKPTVTICYEYLKHILESLPNETTPAGGHTGRCSSGAVLLDYFTRGRTRNIRHF